MYDILNVKNHDLEDRFYIYNDRNRRAGKDVYDTL